MKVVQAEAVAARLWNRNDKDGWTQAWIHRRITKSPRFVVGYTTFEKGRTTSHAMGGSNVDWESAFFVAANESQTEIARVFEAIAIVTASPALRVACPKCGEDPGD